MADRQDGTSFWCSPRITSEDAGVAVRWTAPRAGWTGCYCDAGVEVVSATVQPRLPGRNTNRIDALAVFAASTTATLAHDAVRPVRSGPGLAAAAGSVQAEAST